MSIVGMISDHQWGAIYDINDLAPTLQAVNYKEAVKIMVEDVRCLKQVRNEYGKEIRKQYENGKEVSWKEMKEYEPRDDGLSNTLTGVIKDNMVIYMSDEDKKVVVAGELSDSNVVQDKQVYDVEGVSPAIKSAQGSGSRDKILWSVMGDVKEAKGKDEIPGGVVVEGQEIKEGDVMAMQTPGRVEKRQNGPRLKDDGTSFTVTAADKDGIATNENSNLRIRYLTPRECLRLQAFPDDAIDRIEKVLSKSAMYKVAGNSIAVCCLKAIFKGIYIDKTFKKGTRQVSLSKWF